MAEPQKVVEEALKKVAARLECGICLEQYKDPKLLPCFHVFCKQCLERLVQKKYRQSTLQCPNCRRTTALPLQGVSGLQSDFHANHLFEIQDTLAKLKESQKSQCEKCKKSTATGFCQDCGKFVCDKCIEIHQMWEDIASHQIVTMQDLQANAASLVPPKKKVLYCPQHKEKLLELYCKTCNTLICSNCTIRLHHGHQYDVASDTFKKHKQEIADQLQPVKYHLATVNKALHSFEARSREIQDQRDANQAEIHKQIDQLQQALEQRRTELIGQLDQLTQHKLKSLAAQRDQVVLLHTQLASCLEYVEGSLKTGTQGEILEMKAPLLKQMSQITADFNPDALTPKEIANIALIADSELHHACEKFAKVAAAVLSVCPEKCYSTGNGLRGGTVGKLASVTVHCISQVGKEYRQAVSGIAAKLVCCKDTLKVKCQVKKGGDGEYEIQYQPATRGQHQLHITIGGRSIKGSPYSMVAGPALHSLGKPVKVIPNVHSPWGIATNSKGHIVVAERGGSCISVFTPEGVKIQSFGRKGTAPGEFIDPFGITVDRDDNIIVMDSSNNRIQKFTSEGKFLTAVGTKGSGPLQFTCPTGVGINTTNSKLYIAEDGPNHRIQILNKDMTLSSCFGRNGRSENGHFNNPLGVAFDSTGNLYVADCYNYRVQVFTPEGKFLRKFGVSDEHGSKPYSIAIDSKDTVYIAGWDFNCILIYTSQGQFLRSFSSTGKADGQLQSPRGVALDKDGYILVSDTGNNRIQLF